MAFPSAVSAASVQHPLGAGGRAVLRPLVLQRRGKVVDETMPGSDWGPEESPITRQETDPHRGRRRRIGPQGHPPPPWRPALHPPRSSVSCSPRSRSRNSVHLRTGHKQAGIHRQDVPATWTRPSPPFPPPGRRPQVPGWAGRHLPPMVWRLPVGLRTAVPDPTHAQVVSATPTGCCLLPQLPDARHSGEGTSHEPSA